MPPTYLECASNGRPQSSPFERPKVYERRSHAGMASRSTGEQGKSFSATTPQNVQVDNMPSAYHLRALLIPTLAMTKVEAAARWMPSRPATKPPVTTVASGAQRRVVL